MTEQILPCNIEATDADVARAESILSSSENYIARYLRRTPTVGLAKLPARDPQGLVIEDAPMIRRRVICAGVPYACMIAFMYSGKLYIGWSKRIETRRLIASDDLNSLFNGIIGGDYNVETAARGREGALGVFAGELVKFMTCQDLKEVELPFSKKAGRIAAVVRGLKDEIILRKNLMESKASGPIPSEVGKSLRQFIEFAEKTYGGKAINVSQPDNVPTKASGTALTIL